MKLKFILFAGAVAMASQVQAQNWVEDSVTMGASYANDVYYNLATGVETPVDAANWHLAFQMTSFGEPSFTATVRSNYVKGQVEVYSLHLSAATSFATLTATDTVGKTNPEDQLINVDSTNWGDGAFSHYAGGAGMFDFGWGIYQGSPNHNLLGDSVYLVKVNGVAFKLWLQEYISMGGNSAIGYKFDIGTLDGSSPVVSQYITRANYSDRLFAYYNITTNTVLDREPNRGDWDLLFTQYPKPMIFGPVPGMLQAYTGVLSNDTMEIAELQNMDPNMVTSANYTSHWTNPSAALNVIGDDWKSFTGMAYAVDTMKSWIIRTNAGDFYQLGFTRFDGGSTGKSVFRSRKLNVTTSVSTATSPLSSFSIYPNPVADQLYVMTESQQNIGDAQLTITDITGKMIYRAGVKVSNGLNAYNISTSQFVNGNYILTLTSGNWKTTQKLVVQH